MEEKLIKDVRKALVKHFLDMIALGILRHQSPLSGYDFLEIIYARFSFKVSPGTVYSVLYRLEREGLIKSEMTGEKRVYVLTVEGQGLLDHIMQSKKEIVEFVETIIEG